MNKSATKTVNKNAIRHPSLNKFQHKIKKTIELKDEI